MKQAEAVCHVTNWAHVGVSLLHDQQIQLACLCHRWLSAGHEHTNTAYNELESVILVSLVAATSSGRLVVDLTVPLVSGTYSQQAMSAFAGQSIQA